MIWIPHLLDRGGKTYDIDTAPMRSRRENL